jgi:hypothetical protein
VVLVVVFAGGAGSARAAAPGTTCSGGLISSGTYQALTVTGPCAVPDGATVRVTGGLTVASTGLLDASSCTAHVAISGGVHVEPGGLLYLGGSGDSGCAVNSDTVVNGGAVGDHPTAFVIHGTRINGGMTVVGSGSPPVCFVGHYVTAEDSTINGGVSVSDTNTCWIGLIRDTVNGGMRIDNNQTSDTDAIEVLMNTINGGLACSGNFLNPAVTPDPTPGAPNGVPTNFADFAGPFPNTVTGAETGQCVGL